jgi:hypothetical protein
MSNVLEAYVDGARVARLEAPREIAPRDWILGVIAVQLDIEGGRVSARLKAHTTGASEPTLVELVPPAVVHVVLFPEGAPVPALPPIGSPTSHEACARLRAFLDGNLVGDSELATAPAASGPPARAFGHVFCRWMRDGGAEPGFDLTDFRARPEGEKYERLLARTLAPGQVVTYGLAAAALGG